MISDPLHSLLPIQCHANTGMLRIPARLGMLGAGAGTFCLPFDPRRFREPAVVAIATRRGFSWSRWGGAAGVPTTKQEGERSLREVRVEA